MLVCFLKEIYKMDIFVCVIGICYGEKFYELLVICEEMVKVEDMGNYYWIFCDVCDFNYDKYFVEG